MKICFLMATPFNLGGEQRVTSVLANILCKKNDVTILCTNNKIKINYQLYNLDPKVNILFLNEKRNIFNKINAKIKGELDKINTKTGIFCNSLMIQELITYNNKINNNIIEVINKEEFDIVIGVARTYSLILAKISKKIKAKVIGWQHNNFEVYFNMPGKALYYKEKLVRKMLNRLDNYIVLTNYDKEKIKEKFNIEVRTIYNPKSFKSSDISNLVNKQFFIAGRMVQTKGFDFLIESFKIFAEKNKEWKLVIVGDGEEREKIIKKVKEYNLHDRIRIEHTTDNIKSYFLDSSIYLMTSRWEGMPMIILESFEMGVPVISYDIPAMKEIINESKSGILVPKFDVEKFAEAMLKLANDEKLRKEMGREAKKRANLFSYEAIEKEWEEVFNSIEGEK